jgi:hypothetical protein
MDQAVEDALVIGHEPLISELVLPDPDDRHVLAAAIRGRADVIVTFNIKHFPGELLAPFRIETRHPNLFIRDVLDLNEAVALGAVIGHRGSLRHPAFSAEEYLDLLLRQGLAGTVAFLRSWEDFL